MGGRRLVALVLVFAVACATSGRRFDPDSVPKIRPEISTRADVERWFGDPQTVSTTGSGHSRWTYLYEERTTRDTRTITKIWRSIASVFGGRIFVPPVDVAYENVSRHRLVVWFDSSGTVADYTYARTDLPKKRIY